MNKLSIIIPVYQVDKYLRQCVDSVLSQSLKDIVVYLVDDGSEDESAKICDEYAKKDSRVITIHRLNGGLAEARNTALSFVNTPYVAFLDSDDYISNIYAYETIVENMEKYGADLCLFPYHKFEDGINIPIIENKEINASPRLFSVYDFQKWLTDKSNDSHPVVSTNKVYKTEVIERIRFESKNLVEDSRFIANVFPKCKTFIRLDYPLLQYRMRYDSQSHGRSIKMCCDHVLSEMTVLNFVVGTENSELIRNWIIRWLKLFFVDYYEVKRDKIKENQADKEYILYWKKACGILESYFSCVYPIIKENRNLPKNIRIMCFLYKNAPYLSYLYYKFMLKGYY